MPNHVVYPGVYVEEASGAAGAIPGVETAVTAFVAAGHDEHGGNEGARGNET